MEKMDKEITEINILSGYVEHYIAKQYVMKVLKYLTDNKLDISFFGNRKRKQKSD